MLIEVEVAVVVTLENMLALTWQRKLISEVNNVSHLAVLSSSIFVYILLFVCFSWLQIIVFCTAFSVTAGRVRPLSLPLWLYLYFCSYLWRKIKNINKKKPRKVEFICTRTCLIHPVVLYISSLVIPFIHLCLVTGFLLVPKYRKKISIYVQRTK